MKNTRVNLKDWIENNTISREFESVCGDIVMYGIASIMRSDSTKYFKIVASEKFEGWYNKQIKKVESEILKDYPEVDVYKYRSIYDGPMGETVVVNGIVNFLHSINSEHPASLVKPVSRSFKATFNV